MTSLKSKIFNLHCLLGMREMADCSVDSIVTDPPYELGFMGKSWDKSGIAYNVEVWREALRVLKPGGHLLAFGGTRTYHRLTCAIEDAGFEIRDQIQWIYGSGFPKSLDVSKAIDKMQGATRKEIGTGKWNKRKINGSLGVSSIGLTTQQNYQETVPATDEAKQWEGFGTALKPAHEPICLARKPLSEKTVAQNVLKWGTGAINIDGCRIETNGENRAARYNGKPPLGEGDNIKFGKREKIWNALEGRFPANVIHDGSDEVEAEFAKAPKVQNCGSEKKTTHNSGMFGIGTPGAIYKDEGTPSRFFYCAKTSKTDRNEGLKDFELKRGGSETFDPQNRSGVGENRMPLNQNNHPTVKPTDLMRYLCRLVTPPKGVILDMFMGSGSTGKAAIMEGFEFIGIELVKEYFEIAEARIARAKYEPKQEQGNLFAPAEAVTKQVGLF